MLWSRIQHAEPCRDSTLITSSAFIRITHPTCQPAPPEASLHHTTFVHHARAHSCPRQNKIHARQQQMRFEGHVSAGEAPCDGNDCTRRRESSGVMERRNTTRRRPRLPLPSAASSGDLEADPREQRKESMIPSVDVRRVIEGR